MLKDLAIIVLLSNLHSINICCRVQWDLQIFSFFLACCFWPGIFFRSTTEVANNKIKTTKSKLHRVAAILRLGSSQINYILSEHISQILCIDVGKIFQYVNITEQIKTTSCTLNFSCNLVLQSSCDIHFTSYGISVAEDHKTFTFKPCHFAPIVDKATNLTDFTICPGKTCA